MRVTFILRDLSDRYYADLSALSPLDAYRKLERGAFGDLKLNIKIKIGSGAFRDRVELNQIMRGPINASYTLSPRRGYMLAEFTITN